MTKRGLIYRIQLFVFLLGIWSLSNAQIRSVGKDWGGLTAYSSGTVVQDSIFVFFSSAASPKKGNIKAQFSDGSISNFQWYKYDFSKPVSSRFVAYQLVNGVTESNLTNLDKGGYKVSITRVTDPSTTETYYCWVMIDEVVITRLDVDNRCDFLEVIAVTLPTKLSISNYSIFSYWDIKTSSSYQPIIDKYGKEYFNSIVWHASNTVPITSDPSLVLTIGNPAPLQDSKYDITITNPFGRILKATTDLLPAKAAKADFTLYVDTDGNDTWIDGGSEPHGEAPLRLKFDTKSENADSVFWQVLNDKKLFNRKEGDSIIWKEGYLLADAIGIIPNEKLVPGTFPVEHIALKVNSGCRDTMTIDVVVDSSEFIPDAIPNFFSPNGDDFNQYFEFKDIENKIKSIKSFKISIFSRQGMLVYSYAGNPKEWKWDGKMDGSNRDAPDGIYYFIIEAKGWDNRSFKRGPYKGFVYLFRGR